MFMMDDDKIMTLEEVAEYLRVKPTDYLYVGQEKKSLLQSLGRNGVSGNQ